MTARIACALVATLVAGAVLAAGAGGQNPRGVVTLVQTAAPIAAFAQDGRRLVWATTARGGCAAVHMRDLRTEWQGALTSPRGPTCRTGFAASTTLAVGGIRAIWSLRQSDDSISIVTAAPDTAGDLVVSRRVGGTVVGMMGDGTPLVYGWTRGGAGGIDYVDGRKILAMRDAPVPALLAINGGRIAVVPRGGASAVQVRLLDGTLERTLRFRGAVRAVALSPTLLSVLVDAPGARRIEGFSLTTGARLSAHAVARATAPMLSMADERVVYRIGRSIRMLRVDRPDERARVVATANRDPRGMSIEADRIAWAENDGGRGRIRAIFV